MRTTTGFAPAPFNHTSVAPTFNFSRQFRYMRERVLDFLERFFNFAPDGGDGTVEVLTINCPLIVGASILTSIWRSRHSSGRDT